MTRLAHLISEAQATSGAFFEAVDSLPPRQPTLGELIDAAVLAHTRFVTCTCSHDCGHDEASLDAAHAVRAYVRDKLGLTQDQADALGGIL